MPIDALISIERARSYEPEKLKPILARLFKPFGGLEKIVKRGNRVLIKPNFLTPSHPDQAVNTHPLLLRTILELCLDLGSHPIVGENTGILHLKKVAQVTGLQNIAKRLGVPIQAFTHPVRIKSIHGGRTLDHFEIDRLVEEADVVLNIPKLKTHPQLVLTGAVKNLFGCLTGRRKARIHRQSKDKENFFAEMLVENYQLINPTFTLVDAITAMEGDGPVQGIPKPLGLLIGGKDAVAIDRVLCEIINMDTRLFPVLKAAEELNAGCLDLSQIQIAGALLEEIRAIDFVQANPIAIPALPRLRRLIRNMVRSFDNRSFKEPSLEELPV